MSSQQPDLRPASLADALRRYETIKLHLQHLEPRPLPADLLNEVRLLAGWLDVDGEIRRLRAVLCGVVERLADEEIDSNLLAPLWLLCDHLDPVADAAAAVQELGFYQHLHELAEAKAGATNMVEEVHDAQ